MTDDYQQKLDDLWAVAYRRFNYPALPSPKIVDKIDGMDSAVFDFSDLSTKVSRGFLDSTAPYLHPDRTLEACLNHEIGHYAIFPRDLATFLYLRSEGTMFFQEDTESLFALYADLANEGGLLKTGLGNEEILELRAALALRCDTQNQQESATMQRLLIAKYATTFKFPMPELTEEDKPYFAKIEKIPYIMLTRQEHLASFYEFGKAMRDLLKKAKKNSPNASFGSGNGTSECQPGQGAPNPLDPLSGGGEGDISKIDKGAIERALSEILREHGVGALRRAKEYLKSKRPDFKDVHEQKASDRNKQAGILPGSFRLHDDCIPIYRRWAATYGVHIAKRPLEEDATALVRSGKKDYEVGDPSHRIDVHGSRGYPFIPGIGKVHLEEESLLPDKKWIIPHALIGIDTSGSMDAPDEHNGSMSVLAAFILAHNYYRNGSKVGVWNVSTDIVFANPTRDIESIDSLLCGYWGGGTFFNVEKVKKFLEEMQFDKRGYNISTDEEYQKAAELLTDAQRREAMEKNLEIRAPELRKKVARLDNILITDGFIWNMDQVLLQLQTLGDVTRNFVFITNTAGYDQWKDIQVPNTTVHLAATKKDLIGLSLDRVRRIGREK